jgi:hypothetical protein
MKFPNASAAVQYITEQCAQGLPAGWALRKERHSPLFWRIVPRSDDQWSDEDYGLEVTEDLQKIILYYDNDDHGGLELHHVFLKAKVLSCDALEHFPLADVLRRTIGTLKMNRWGLT